MENISNGISYTSRILCTIAFLMLFPIVTVVEGADPEPPESKDTGKKNNNFELFAEYGMEYIDNVYQLNTFQIWRLQKNDQQDKAGGRFEGMESESDIVVQPSMGLRYDSDSPLGGKFTLTTWVRAYNYTKNERSSYPEARVRLKNTIGKNGDLTLEGTFLSGFFKRNYLSDINDAYRNGNLPREKEFIPPLITMNTRGPSTMNIR